MAFANEARRIAEESFFAYPADELARRLLGCYLCHDSVDGLTIGRIIETEAYSQEDEASHSFKGRNARNSAMFGPPGTIYVYLSYGLHYCMNISADREGWGAGVLLRAIEPVVGIELMQRRRGGAPCKRVTELARGPGRLTQAMGVDMDFNGACILTSKLYLRPRARKVLPTIRATWRIGISKAKEKPWRFIST